MAWSRRRTGLERAALAVAVMTIVAIATVALGVFDDSRSQAAARVTQACRPVAALDLDDPGAVRRTEVLALRQVSAGAARAVRGLMKNTHGDLRREVAVVQRLLTDAADPYGQFTLERRAGFLGEADAAARRFGARCPSPITPASARLIDERFARQQARR